MRDGKVSQSGREENLFEYQYNIDHKNKIITRIKVRRLDESTARNDSTVYNITEIKKIHGSRAGLGGEVIVAVSKDGNEFLEIGTNFAFSSRTSPFSQIINGVYKRLYTADDR